MAVRFTPTSQHFVLEVRNLLHQHLVASHKLFKQSIRFISGKLSLIRVLPHGFSAHVVPDVFVHARSNVFMIILSKPFLKRVESSFFSLLSIDTGKNGSRHVDGLTVCKRLILQAKLTGIYTIWSAPRLGDPGPSGSGMRAPARARPVRPVCDHPLVVARSVRYATTRSWSPEHRTYHYAQAPFKAHDNTKSPTSNSMPSKKSIITFLDSTVCLTVESPLLSVHQF